MVKWCLRLSPPSTSTWTLMLMPLYRRDRRFYGRFCFFTDLMKHIRFLCRSISCSFWLSLICPIYMVYLHLVNKYKSRWDWAPVTEHRTCAGSLFAYQGRLICIASFSCNNVLPICVIRNIRCALYEREMFYVPLYVCVCVCVCGGGGGGGSQNTTEKYMNLTFNCGTNSRALVFRGCSISINFSDFFRRYYSQWFNLGFNKQVMISKLTIKCDAVVLCAKFKTDLTIEINVRFELSFGGFPR